MSLYQWTSLGRGYDLQLKHNRIILILTLLAALAVASGRHIIYDSGWVVTLLDGFTGGATVFSAGIMAKELAPDYPQTALAAVVLSLFIAWTARLEILPLIFWLIGCMRLLNRTSGLAAKPTDILVLIAFTAWLVWWFSPLFGLLAAFMLWQESRLPDGLKNRAVVAFLIFFMTAAYVIAWGKWQLPAVNTVWATAILLAITLFFIPVILNSYEIHAVGDATGVLLTPARVQTGQFFALATGLVTASWLGTAGIILLLALWAAILAVAGHYLTRRSRVHLPVSV